MADGPTCFISVISGKGGTGKTLMTAILGRALAKEGRDVLLIDLDIFVRGLSILLAEYTKKIPAFDVQTVSEFLLSGKANSGPEWVPIHQDKFKGWAVSKFFECDVLPATRGIGDPLDYDELAFTSPSFCKGFIDNLFFLIRGKYDIVLIDCRAGMDSLVTTLARKSAFVISVSEDDKVSLQADDNIRNHLRYNEKVKGVFTVINKGRRINTYKDLQNSRYAGGGLNMLGILPFDKEIMQDFGEMRLWNTVYETLYFRALIDAWNNFAESNGLIGISKSYYKFPPSIFMGKSSGRLTLVERMLRMYGLGFITAAVSLFVYRYVFRSIEFDEMSLTIIISLFIGILSLFMSGANIRQWLLGKKDIRGDIDMQ